MTATPDEAPGLEPRRSGGWKGLVPWPVKLAGKVVGGIAAPVALALQKVGGYDHGPMKDCEYVAYWVDEHMRRASLGSLEGRHVLELGPGDAVTSALVAAARGAESMVLIDEMPFASVDVSLYQAVAAELRQRGLRVPDISGARSLADVLERCGATYLTGGLRSLSSLRDGSIDVSWSQAVLEHVRLRELEQLVLELHRVHRPGSPSSHRVDFQDHLAGSLNSLRFPQRVWERPALFRSGAYTNRLRVSQLLDEFIAAGFSVTELSRRSWAEPPVPRRYLAKPFRDLPEADLCCAEVDFIAVA